MKTLNIFKKASLGLTTLVVGLLMSGAVASAIQYTGNNTVASPVPAFNVFTGNMPAPAPANTEANFFRGRVPANGNQNDATTQYSDPVSTTCKNGEVIQMNIYVHNGASQDTNSGGNGSSVAHGTKVKVALPGNEADSFNANATISANNAATVSDGLTINCNGKKVKLQYVAGSASQYSKGSGVVALSDAIVGNGVAIRSHNVSGDVWGCWEDRVYVVLSAKVVETPPVVTPPVVTAMCKLFSVTATADRKVIVNNFTFTAQNATFKNVVINWADGSSTTVTDATKVVGTSHQYNADGTYKIVATVTFMSENGNITSAPASCQQEVTFSSTKPPVVVPPAVTPPTTLVNAGAGSVAGLFAAVSAVGAVGYRWFLGRRLGQDS